MTLAFLAALIIGLSLGFLGAGGSVITVPSLVFILGRPEKIAVAESMFIVGVVAFFGALPYLFRGEVMWKSVIYFGVPGILGACLGGCGTYFIDGKLQMALIGLMMLVIGGVMFSNISLIDRLPFSQQSPSFICFEGFLVGCMTGLIGIGGGFLIVPSLVFLFNMSMNVAVGTSLVIIFLNAATGFINQTIFFNALGLSVAWNIVVFFSIVGAFGSLVGGVFGKSISSKYLRSFFGVAVSFIGFYMLVISVL